LPYKIKLRPVHKLAVLLNLFAVCVIHGMADKSYVVDTSAIGAWFIQDEFSPGAERLRDAISAGQVQMYCPDFLLLELANLLIFKRIDRLNV